MTTPSSSPIEEEMLMLEITIPNSSTPKPKPIDLDDLCRSTRFTRQEIRLMYRGLKTVKQSFPA